MALRHIWQHWRSTALARCIGALLRPSPSSPSRLVKRDGTDLNSAEIGALGEVLAAKWLRRHGRKILFQNYRAPHGGEVDIVCRHGKMLAFVEVKTRRSGGLGRPADAVTKDKERLIMRGAQHWLKLLDKPDTPVRCDVVEVILQDGVVPQINVIESVFRVDH